MQASISLAWNIVCRNTTNYYTVSIRMNSSENRCNYVHSVDGLEESFIHYKNSGFLWNHRSLESCLLISRFKVRVLAGALLKLMWQRLQNIFWCGMLS